MTLDLLMRHLGSRYDIDVAMTMCEAERLMHINRYDAILLDTGLPDHPRMTVVEHVKSMSPMAAIVIVSGYYNPDFAKEAIRQSASSYLVKGYDDTSADGLESSINAAISSNRLCHKIEDAKPHHGPKGSLFPMPFFRFNPA